mmetsp:Transcript_56405/g.150234  ORF Transcript_56405/g.150234 Transcript_56405/m.150234 type:complete len:234 (+) Transcript_56405:708-1409(+)
MRRGPIPLFLFSLRARRRRSTAARGARRNSRVTRACSRTFLPRWLLKIRASLWNGWRLTSTFLPLPPRTGTCSCVRHSPVWLRLTLQWRTGHLGLRPRCCLPRATVHIHRRFAGSGWPPSICWLFGGAGAGILGRTTLVRLRCTLKIRGWHHTSSSLRERNPIGQVPSGLWTAMLGNRGRWRHSFPWRGTRRTCSGQGGTWAGGRSKITVRVGSFSTPTRSMPATQFICQSGH